MTETLGMAVSKRQNDILLALAVVSMTLMLVFPLTPIMLDILISFSIVLSVTTLLVTLFTEESLNFSSFPSLLLIMTLFRLGLNIASTRMILTEAQAGEIIRTFGEFVTGGNQLVGFLIFVLLTGINFVVITKGSGRVAEVAARFNLDSMPGKQMAIDADVNAGVINEQQAQERREKIMAESDFYGAMDGASKFVRGDAIAGMIIIFVTIIGSFIIGMGMRGMSWTEVVHTYMKLTIGDGLVTQIPALLVSVGAGIIVTRSSSKQHLGDLFHQQLFNNPFVLTTTAAILTFLSLIPGMPKIVMLSMALVIYIYARIVSKYKKTGLIAVPSWKETVLKENKDVEKILFLDAMELEFGEKLSSLHQKGQEQLLTRINTIRRQIASELGIVLPNIRIRSNPFLPPNTYVIKIKGNEVDSSNLYLNLYLAMNPGHITQKVAGIQTVEPAFKLPATWITDEQRQNAENLGYAIADPLSVLMTHLTEVIHLHAHELLNRQEAARLIEHARMTAPAVVEELVPRLISLGDVLKVLQNLLKERVSIRDIVSILELLADNINTTKDIDLLTEYVRLGLARTISKQYMDQNKVIHAITLDPKMEQMMLESIQKNEFGKHIVLYPGTTKKMAAMVKEMLSTASEQGVQVVLLTSSVLRPYVKKFIERSLPSLPVLAFNEIIKEVQITSVGTISLDIFRQL